MATKKITELPLIQTVSGSFSVVPIVIGNTAGNGTTDQITIENFSRFVTQYSAHTGSAGNTFTGPQTINNNVTITGNEVVNGNVTITGRLTVTEVVAQYETASILFSTGSTKLGDQLTDKHEFTGSTNITGSLIYNNVLVTNVDANTIQKLQQATASIELASASFNYFYQSTASLQQFTSSQDARNFIISQFTSSTNAHIVGISNFTSSNFDTMARVYQTSASINIFTGSQDSRNYVISQFTSSTDAHIVGISTFTSSQYDTIARVYQTSASINIFTGSQDARNFIISQFTSSTNTHIVGISTFTSSQYDTMARVYQTTSSLQSTTASLNQFTASQDSRNFVVSQVTGSLIGITNGLMAFTAALDNTYATDAQLFQLYQSTRSLELHSGSMVGVTNGLMAYTASNTSLNTGLRGEVDGIEAYTASLKGQAIVSSSTQVQNYDVFALNSKLYTSTGSLIGITNGLMAFTAALDNTYATDAQLYQLYQATRSIELTTGSLIGITNGLMAFTAALDSTYATDAQLFQLYQATRSIELTTGSLIGITNGLMAFTASLDNTFATDVQLLPILQATRSLELLSGSLIGITNGLMAFTAALDNTYATDAQLYQLYQATRSIELTTGSLIGIDSGLMAYTASLKGAAIVSSSQQIQNYNLFAVTASANHFYGNQSISGSLRVTGSLKVGDWFHGEGVANTAKLDIRTAADRGLKVTGGTSSDVIITAYRGASDDMVRTMRLEGNAINIYIGDGNANTGSSVASFNTNGLSFENGKGIDFSATANSGSTVTSEILNDYEAGTWTPTDASGASLTFTTVFGRYIKIGKQVTIHFRVSYPSTVSGATALFGGLPYVVESNANNFMGGIVHWTDASMDLTLMAIDATSTLSLSLIHI